MALPKIIVTGASGFVGRHLLEEIQESYRIYAFGRRSQKQCGAPVHENISWTQVDIAEREPLTAAFDWIRQQGRVDYFVHLAAHYDFTGKRSVEYRRTNIRGLRYILDEAETLGLKRFVFASSVAACSFSKAGRSINEETSADARNYYAVSKRIGEEMVRSRAESVPGCILRFAAIYTDWCEYPPLFNFLSNWLSDGWNARMIGGRGGFAIPYLHVRCAVSCLRRLIENPEPLEPAEVFLASPDGAVRLMDLYESATLAFFGERRRPIFVPLFLTSAWLHVQDAVGRIIGRRPFERPWMARYLDQQLRVDAQRTRQRLDWAPRKRFGILRRMPFLVENLRTRPLHWSEINHAAMRKEESRESLRIQWLLEKNQSEICTRHVDHLLRPDTDALFGTYHRLDREQLEARVQAALSSLRASIRTREMDPVGQHCLRIARDRFKEGFTVDEVSAAIEHLGWACEEVLREEGLEAGLETIVHDRIGMALQFGIDEIWDEFESLEVLRRRGVRVHA